METGNPSPVLEAATTGDLDLVKHFLAAEKCPSEELIQMVLTSETWHSRIPVVFFLLSEYPSVPFSEETIRAAVYSGSIELFTTILSKDPSIINLQFDKRCTPLAVACMSQRSLSFLEFILEAGPDPNQYQNVVSYPLAAVAALYKDTSAAELLLKHGAKLEHSGALAAAAVRGNEVMVRYLLEHGAQMEMDTDSVEGRLPGLALHIAAENGFAGVVRILLEYGTDVGKRMIKAELLWTSLRC